MITFPKKALMAAAGLSAALAFAPAHANVMATSMIDMTNFQILGSDGAILDAAGANTATPTGDFSFLTFTSTAAMHVAVGGSTLTSASSSAPIDFAPICVGSGCNPLLPNNSLPKLTAPPVGNYAAADQLEAGGPLANLAGFPNPAHIANESASGLTTGSNLAHSDSTNNLNSSFQFKVANDQTTGITFAFDLNAYLQVAVSGSEQFPGTATSAYDVNFTLTDLTTPGTPFVFSPDAFGNGVKTLSLNAPLGIDVQLIQDTGGPLAFSKTTGALKAGDLYQLSARINTNADVQRVPEPGSVALVGIALAIMGGWARRRRFQA
jgi:hypothetical protein